MADQQTNQPGIMLQGTSSHVGKSILCTALCRILYQDGYAVAPFKSQNMALNSTVTPDGGEIGRAQGAQAQAAGTDPSVYMNPVLVKPKQDMQAQIVVKGKPLSDMSAREYRENYLPVAGDVVQEALAWLHSQYQVIVIEGAGSPAEVNLKDAEIANMRTACWAGVPVLLVADIDRGGVFASLIGTLELLEPWERQLVQGFIINKFRGDLELLKPGLHFLEEKTNLPVLGVIPYLHNHGIEEEDSVSLQGRSTWGAADAPVHIAVLQFPRIANFTDLYPLTVLPETNIRLVKPGERIGSVDAVILPGTKNTWADYDYLQQQGYDREIKELAQNGAYIVGICGGYQMMGERLLDPAANEDTGGTRPALGLLEGETTYCPSKQTYRVEAEITANQGWLAPLKGTLVSGYEIHMGQTAVPASSKTLFRITTRSGQAVQIKDGTYSANGRVWGTHLHGLFSNRFLLQAFINALRRKKGLPPLAPADIPSFSSEDNYNRLAAVVRQALDMPRLYQIMGLKP